MKNSVLAFLLLTLVSLGSSAQIFQKEKYPTKYVKGTKYYVHIVEKGHTVYAISKKYAVDMDFLVKSNPGIDDGLQIGEEILIPVFRVNRRIARRYTPELKGKYLIHVVQKKETLYSISKNYGVEVNVIKAYNPVLDVGLKEGQELRIPVNANEEEDGRWLDPAGEQDDPRFIYHEVFKQETLYSLSKLYGVSVNQIKVSNDGLVDGLKVGTVIRIPRVQSPTNGNHSGDSTTTANDFFSRNLGNKAFKEEYEVALLLPFNAELGLEQETLGQNQFGLEFYNGFKLGVDVRNNEPGPNFKIKVFDTEGDAITTKKLLSSNKLQTTDLFVGPFFKTPLVEVLDFSRTTGAKVVCPVQQNPSLLQNNDHLSTLWPSHYVQTASVAGYINREHPTENVILLECDSAADYKIAQVFKRKMNSLISKSLRRYKDSVTVVNVADFEVEAFKELLDPDGYNNLVFPSIDVLAVTEWINKISELHKEYKIRVFGSENWFSYKQIDEDYLERFEVHLPAGIYLDYDNPIDQKFIREYSEQFKTEPSKFAFLGYNTALYYMNALSQYGLIYPSVYGEIDFPLPNMVVNFSEPFNGVGYQNRGTQLLKFKDLQWNKVMP